MMELLVLLLLQNCLVLLELLLSYLVLCVELADGQSEVTLRPESLVVDY